MDEIREVEGRKTKIRESTNAAYLPIFPLFHFEIYHPINGDELSPSSSVLMTQKGRNGYYDERDIT